MKDTKARLEKPISKWKTGRQKQRNDRVITYLRVEKHTEQPFLRLHISRGEGVKKAYRSRMSLGAAR